MWSEVVRLVVDGCWSVGREWHKVDWIVVRNKQTDVDSGLSGIQRPQVDTTETTVIKLFLLTRKVIKLIFVDLWFKWKLFLN